MTPELAGNQIIIEVLYLIASVLFILSLKWMSSPTSARHGIWAGEAGMLLAICGTLLHHGIVDYRLLAIALVLGTIIGIPLGRVAMTAVRGIGRVLLADTPHLTVPNVGPIGRSHSRRPHDYRKPDGGGQTAGDPAAKTDDL